MKRTILISLAAGVAIVPALLGVAAASPSAPARSPISDDSRTSTPTASSTVDDRGHGADDGAATDGSATGHHDARSVLTAATRSDDRQGRGSDDATASSASSADDRQGRDSDDATTSSPRTTVTSSSSRATSSATVDDKGHGTEAGDDSGGHGGKSGKN